ncbi:helix-turn-helix domain-containing protein [Pirellulaceae bacterium SH449]
MKTATSSPPADVFPTLPSVTVTELNDPTLVGGSIEILKQDVLKLSSERFRAKRIVVRLGHCQVVYHSTNVAVRARTSLQPGFIGYTLFSPTSAGTINGTPIHPEQILAITSGIEAELVVAAGYESIALLLPPELLLDYASRWQHDEVFLVPQNIELLTPSPSGRDELFKCGQRLIGVASQQPEVFDVPEVQFAAQTELIEKLLSALRYSKHVEPSLQDLKQQGYSKIVTTAQDYANVHIGERIHVADLCVAAGVSERTLQYAFKGVLGMSPMSYLTIMRLHRVRKSLQSESQASTTVTKEALRWGFWHFGDFSRAYKECFGEHPSDTLRGQTDAG